MVGVRIIGDCSEDEMVACFLRGELTSARFGAGIRRALAAAGRSERLVIDADLTDQADNRARRELLATTRGYGENRDVFEDFPNEVRWIRAVLTAGELARVRYIEYSYWHCCIAGSADALTLVPWSGQMAWASSVNAATTRSPRG